jgi:hypothetical protein
MEDMRMIVRPEKDLKSMPIKIALVGVITSVFIAIPGSASALCDLEEAQYCISDCQGEYDIAEAACNHDLAVAMDECDAWWNILNRSECRIEARNENTACKNAKWEDRNWCRTGCRENYMNDCS